MRRLIVLVIPLAIILSGCGLAQKASNVSVHGQDTSMTMHMPDGQNVTIQGSEGKLPDGFPLQVHPGGKLTGSSVMKSDEKQASVIEVTFDKDPAAVADYYEKALNDLGLKIERAALDNQGETTITLAGESDKWVTRTVITWSAQDHGKVLMELVNN